MPSPSSSPVFHEAPLGNLHSRWAKFWAPYLNDPRDIVFINLSLQMTLVLWPCAITLFVWQSFNWLWAVAYWLLAGVLFMDRYILMLHCTSHRPLFKRSFRFFNHYIPWALGPLIGETPESYYVHHMGMHHKEGNLGGDLSSTMPFQRDKFSHWLRYWGRFMVFGLFDLARYHSRNKNKKLLRRLLIGEGSFWTLCLVLGLTVSWQATLVVFIIPVLIVRTIMMAGNWGQHAFIHPDEPHNDFKNSITCIHSRYNRRSFNDGYHIVHHLKPSLHYSEMADEFHKNREKYGAQDAIVFEGLDFFAVWFLLMTGQKKKLAQAFVQLPGAPERNQEQIVELIQQRMRPFPQPSALSSEQEAPRSFLPSHS